MLNKFLEKINNSGRIAQELSRKEIIECLDIIANDMISGKSTLLHANTLLAIRHGLMSSPEKMVDEIKTLGEIASEMGKKGGSAKTEAKQKSSRENGKLGGRPKKVKD